MRPTRPLLLQIQQHQPTELNPLPKHRQLVFQPPAHLLLRHPVAQRQQLPLQVAIQMDLLPLVHLQHHHQLAKRQQVVLRLQLMEEQEQLRLPLELDLQRPPAPNAATNNWRKQTDKRQFKNKAQLNVGQIVQFKDTSNLGYPTISRSFRDGEEEI
jgi:hypothetical protein